ncbi:MAG: T9SS type A sorting domain-containing protein, partial [bacterium]|nr:T9SS type A sorting domain-containing protein [bacterium]
APTGILPTRGLVFDLQQNHPNPFNPVTQIRFSVPQDGLARLTIHDISGRLVRVIVNGWMPAGTYVKEWNARNDQGRAVASGVYFYRLEAGQNSVTRKAVLLK